MGWGMICPIRSLLESIKREAGLIERGFLVPHQILLFLGDTLQTIPLDGGSGGVGKVYFIFFLQLSSLLSHQGNWGPLPYTAHGWEHKHMLA